MYFFLYNFLIIVLKYIIKINYKLMLKIFNIANVIHIFHQIIIYKFISIIKHLIHLISLVIHCEDSRISCN